MNCALFSTLESLKETPCQFTFMNALILLFAFDIPEVLFFFFFSYEKILNCYFCHSNFRIYPPMEEGQQQKVSVSCHVNKSLFFAYFTLYF